MQVSIYALSDPVTKQVRYIGKAKDVKHRFTQHVANAETGYKANWIRGLKSRGMRPTVEVIEEVDETEWEVSERFWIAYFRFLGFSLMNIDLGGNGAHKVADSMREKCRLIHLGKKRSAEARERLRLSHLGKKSSPETIAKQSEAQKKRWAATQERKMHPNALAALVKYHKGRKQTPEEIERRVKANTGKKRSPDIRVKMAKVCEEMRKKRVALRSLRGLKTKVS